MLRSTTFFAQSHISFSHNFPPRVRIRVAYWLVTHGLLIFLLATSSVMEEHLFEGSLRQRVRLKLEVGLQTFDRPTKKKSTRNREGTQNMYCFNWFSWDTSTVLMSATLVADSKCSVATHQHLGMHRTNPDCVFHGVTTSQNSKISSKQL